MLLPPCVSIEVANQPSPSSVAVLVERCDAVLGQGRCEVVPDATSTGVAPGCWTARVEAPTDAPLSARVLLRDLGHPERRTVQRGVEFHPRDVPVERWATLGLLIAALVTIEEHSATAPPDNAAERAEREREAERAAALLRASLPPPRASFDVRGGAVLATGMLPGWVWGLRVEANLGSQRWMGQARLSYLPSRSEAATSDGRLGGDFRLVAPGLGVCHVARGARRFSVRICAGGDANITNVQGYGITQPAQHTVVWGAAWGGIAAQLRLFAHAQVFVGIDGTIGLNRPSFTLNSGDFYEVPAFGAYTAAGLAVTY